MPIYEFRCENESCGTIYEVMQRIKDCVDPGTVVEETCDECGHVGLVRIWSSDVSVVMGTRKRPRHVTSSGISAMGPDDDRALRSGSKMSSKVRRSIYQERYDYRNANLEAMCQDEKLVKSGKVDPKRLKKMFSSGAVRKTVSMTAMERPHHRKR